MTGKTTLEAEDEGEVHGALEHGLDLADVQRALQLLQHVVVALLQEALLCLGLRRRRVLSRVGLRLLYFHGLLLFHRL